MKKEITMKDHYDFSKAKRAKAYKSIKIIKTFRLDPEVLMWLEQEGEKEGMGYQTFLNWFLLKSIREKTSIEARLVKLEKAIFKKKD
jgi:predicted DNA binding CopG/RHH family protein